MPTTFELIRLVLAIPAGLLIGAAAVSFTVHLVKAIRGHMTE